MNDMSRRILPPPLDPEEPSRLRGGRTGPFGVLDIGTTKIACLIGRTESDGRLRVLGFGWHRGRGVRAGGITDLDEAEKAIRACVGQAEDMADTRLRAVTVNLSCGQPESRLFNVQWPVGGRAVDESTTCAASSMKAAPARRTRGARRSTRCRWRSPWTTWPASPIRAGCIVPP
jgi:cell division protein FtsA